jgi:hypothetical protein
VSFFLELFVNVLEHPTSTKGKVTMAVWFTLQPEKRGLSSPLFFFF